MRKGASSTSRTRPNAAAKKVRYAVVGLGHIAQNAVLPGFSHAPNSALTTLVSDDPVKLKKLGRKYGVDQVCDYNSYEKCLRSGTFDAVYIALPNHLHRAYAVQAAEAGIHVLCEKPLAVTEAECRDMIEAADRNRVKMMTAYRLHFEKGNLEAVDLLQKGRLGKPRIFNSVFSMQVKAGNIRVSGGKGGGTLYDIGIYCINAARNLFREEPYEVFAYSTSGSDPRFREVDEMTCAILRFPDDKFATFTTSFGAADTAVYRVVGTKGQVILNHGYEYSLPIELTQIINGKEKTKTIPKRDQFGAEIVYFSNCILKNRDPEPSARTGLNDVRIIEALYQSAATGSPVNLTGQERVEWPAPRQEIQKPPVGKQELVHAEAPTRE